MFCSVLCFITVLVLVFMVSYFKFSCQRKKASCSMCASSMCTNFLLLPQVKQNLIILNKNVLYKPPVGLFNILRLAVYLQSRDSPLYDILNKIKSLSQIFCLRLQLPDLTRCDIGASLKSLCSFTHISYTLDLE